MHQLQQRVRHHISFGIGLDDLTRHRGPRGCPLPHPRSCQDVWRCGVFNPASGDFRPYPVSAPLQAAAFSRTLYSLILEWDAACVASAGGPALPTSTHEY